MGSNMAESHPVGFQWVMEAKERGAKVIHVDPRFTRTSAMADLHVAAPRRHRHRLPRRRSSATSSRTAATFREYVVHYTNARDDHPRGLPRHRGPRRAVLRLGSRDAAPTTPSPGGTRAWRSAAASGKREQRRALGRGRPTARTAARSSRASRRSSDRDARAPALRLPGAAPALRPLHARDGRGDLRRPARSSSSRWPRRCARTPGRERTTRVLLRGRLDAAHGRRAEHPRRGDHPAAARQHRPPRRRHPRAARPREHPGLDRHPDALRHPARLHPDAARRRRTATLDDYVEQNAPPAGYWGQHAAPTSSRC